MIEAEAGTNDRPVPKVRSRRRLLGSAASAAIIACAAGTGLLISSASAGASQVAAHTAGATRVPAVGPHGGLFGFGPGGTPPAAAGTVESVDTSGDSFTLKDHAGTTVTVDVTSSTTYGDPKVSSATLSDVTVGEQVAVIGTTSSGTVTATKVLIGTPAGGPGGWGPGFGPGGGPRGGNARPSGQE